MSAATPGRFRARLDAGALVVLGLLLAGTAVRTAITFPAHKYVGDADCMLAGMRAFHVLAGETPVFLAGARLGSIEPHTAAAIFLVAGASRTSLATVALLFGFGLLAALFLFYRELLPPGVALWALVFAAFPSPALLAWTYMPNSYAATLFLCGAILGLAALLERRGPSPAHVVLFGIAAGLGFWQSFQTLGVLGPALVWLLWRRPELRRPRPWALGLAGFVLGAFPWIAYNVVWPLKTFQNNYGVRPAQGIEAALSNAHYFLTYSLREVVTPVNEAFTGLLHDPAVDLHHRLRFPVQLLFLAAALLFLAAPVLRGRAGQAARERVGLSPWVLFILVIAAYAVLNTFSEAGQARGVSVRYVLPLYLVVPGMLALLLSLVAARSRILAVLLAGVIVLFYVTAYHWPGRASRIAWREGAASDERLIELLRQRGVTAVLGGYWTTYPINFLSQERILALPCSSDYYDYRGRRPPERLYRWALVSARPDELERWAARAGVTGSLELAAPQRAALVLAQSPADPAAQEQLVGQLVATCKTQD